MTNAVDPKGPKTPRMPPLKHMPGTTNLPTKVVVPALPPPLKTQRRGGARGR